MKPRSPIDAVLSMNVTPERITYDKYVADLVQMYADRFHGTRGSIKTEDMIPIHIDCAFNQY